MCKFSVLKSTLFLVKEWLSICLMHFNCFAMMEYFVSFRFTCPLNFPYLKLVHFVRLLTIHRMHAGFRPYFPFIFSCNYTDTKSVAKIRAEFNVLCISCVTHRHIVHTLCANFVQYNTTFSYKEHLYHKTLCFRYRFWDQSQELQLLFNKWMYVYLHTYREKMLLGNWELCFMCFAF